MSTPFVSLIKFRELITILSHQLLTQERSPHHCIHEWTGGDVARAPCPITGTLHCDCDIVECVRCEPAEKEVLFSQGDSEVTAMLVSCI